MKLVKKVMLQEIIQVQLLIHFSKKYQARRTKKSQIKLLFRFIQYIERQVVLFDAIEDAAFPVINNMDGIGTLRSLKEKAFSENKMDELRAYLDEFKVRIVLTAHPTQFYPGSVLGIITDLTEAIKDNDLGRINNLLAQLGKTPFFKHKNLLLMTKQSILFGISKMCFTILWVYFRLYPPKYL